jgi:hypothetical protein
MQQTIVKPSTTSAHTTQAVHTPAAGVMQKKASLMTLLGSAGRRLSCKQAHEDPLDPTPANKQSHTSDCEYQ